MRTRLSVLLLVVIAGSGCGGAAQPEPVAVGASSGSESAAPGAVQLAFSDVTVDNPACFYFSGPGTLGRDDQLSGPVTLVDDTLQFAGGQQFQREADGSFVRTSTYEFEGTWTTRERITLSPTSEGFSGDYRYDEFAPDSSPSGCGINARVTVLP
jgi:hypothetical protein